MGTRTPEAAHPGLRDAAPQPAGFTTKGKRRLRRTGGGGEGAAATREVYGGF